MPDSSSSPHTPQKRSLAEKLRSPFHPRPADDDEPQNWWIASTAIPLIAATTAPLANVMSIVALVSSWKVTVLTQTDSFGQPIQKSVGDPRWCIALNATSLACGLVGNLFLLFNFTRTVRYILALPVSIILWFLSTSILIGITAAMHVYSPPVPPNETYSQAYWSAVIAAVLYFILGVILLINMLGYVLGHYPQYFALTDGQRTLILQTTAFVVWLIIGAAIFSNVIGISFADALYFSDVTILTLGYGDITPTTPVARGLVFPYAVIGMIILGLVVNSVLQFAHDIQYKQVIRKHVERKRRATVSRSVSIEPGATSQLEYKPRHSGRPVRSTIDAFALMGRPKQVVMKEEKDRFDAMRAIQRETLFFRRWYNLVLSLIMFGIVWTIGAVAFWQMENITYFQALYFGFCSLLTIGYGDITPSTNAAKPFFIVWSLVAVPTMTTLISEMSDTIVAGFKHATDVAADWTVLPQSGRYAKFVRKIPPLYTALKHREEHKRVAEGFPIGPAAADGDGDPESGAKRSNHLSPSTSPQDGGDGSKPEAKTVDQLANEPGPAEEGPVSNIQLAQKLALAIQRTTRDALNGEPKQYTYEEWVEFTRLIRATDPTSSVELHEDEYGVLNWDWIGETSPMLANQTEPEWVLHRLCESMIRCLDATATTRGAGAREDDEPTLRKERAIKFAEG
ncbi:voltage-gated potassium channel [Aspergillus japonicus CBS 114.51]|uniref:Voltage-gated potassium channel n=2 Tax=Aspergillus TaxID=5052 RepID=A0A2V5HGG2_ASPV1|nr:voltage-gated potassium channel [Aspergillus japonicus CBS 114.51]PYI22851.1 voltage-gated potassium channel [Aspergillus violaceofuscus CBS 115571]RAH80599.1 voltage-gated potassium channel [Aspergillus japonicus CBS 114.51]